MLKNILLHAATFFLIPMGSIVASCTERIISDKLVSFLDETNEELRYDLVVSWLEILQNSNDLFEEDFEYNVIFWKAVSGKSPKDVIQLKDTYKARNNERFAQAFVKQVKLIEFESKDTSSYRLSGSNPKALEESLDAMMHKLSNSQRELLMSIIVDMASTFPKYGEDIDEEKYIFLSEMNSNIVKLLNGRSFSDLVQVEKVLKRYSDHLDELKWHKFELKSSALALFPKGKPGAAQRHR